MRSTNKDMIEAFIDYAFETEGMSYTMLASKGKFWARRNYVYDTVVERAVIRNFKQEWKMFS